MSYCDDKSQAIGLVEEARAEIEARIESGIEDMIEYPADKTPLLKEKLKKATKSADKSSLRKDIIRERARYLEHAKLYKHLIDKSKEYLYSANPFVVPGDFVESRLDWIQGVFQEAYSRSVFADKRGGVNISGLNNSDKWDDGKIRYILNKVQRWEKRADKEGAKLTPFENTIKKPLLTAASLDPSGQARKLVKMTDELLDTFLQKGYQWKVSIIDPKTGQKNPISLQSIDDKISGIGARGDVEGMTPHQKTLAAAQLSEELLHNEVRNIIPRDIPTNPKDFTVWRNSWGGKQFFNMLKFESERHDVGDSDSRYVMIPLHSDKVGVKWLRKQRNAQIKEGSIATDPGESENAFLVYRIPDNLKEFFESIRKNKLITEESLKSHLLPTQLEEGFFTAQKHKVFKYEYIPNTQNPKRKYADWTRGVKFQNNIYEPPAAWMPQMWESIEMQREWSELFFQKVLKKDHKEVIDEYERYKSQVVDTLLKQGWAIEAIQEALDKVNDIGGMQFNITEDKDGNFVSSNSFVRKASRWSYGHIKFEHPVYLAMIEEAGHIIRNSYLPEIEAQLTTDYSVLESGEADAEEESESLEKISVFENRKKHYEDMLDAIDKRLYGGIDTDIDRREMVMVDRILASKGRTLFTDHKRRRKDRSLWKEYVDQATRANELTRLKIQLLKTMLGLQKNPQLVNYLVDQVKAAAGDADIEAGFMNLNYSDKSVASLFGDDITAETIRDYGLIERAFITGANLGSWTSLTNNLQRKNGVINYGLESVVGAINAIKDGDENFSAEEILEQVEETGVLHPGNAFIDMLTLGMDFGEGVSWKEAILPLTDTMRLWKATTLDGWINQSGSWDKLISAARQRSEGEKIQVQELRRVKEELYDIMHSETKDNPREKNRLKKRLLDLRIGLTQANINRLVKWKLGWFPLGVLEPVLTMSGSERQMRAEFSYIGMREVFDSGRIDVPENKKWKYTDSEDAVNMSRLSVLMNLFGFTKVMAPKMFRGAVGGAGLQFRQYDYNQMIIEMEWLRSAALSPQFAQKSRALGWGALPFRMTLQIMKKIIRGGIKSTKVFGVSPDQVKYWEKMIRLNKEHDDKNLDRAANFFLITAPPTIMTKFLYHTFAPYTILRSIQSISRAFLKDKTTMRAARGFESPLISKSITMAVLFAVALGIGRRGLDDEEDAIEDFIRELPFSIFITTMFLWITDFSKNAYRGARPYLTTPFKELAPGAPGTGPLYEAIDDFTSF